MPASGMPASPTLAPSMDAPQQQLRYWTSFRTYLLAHSHVVTPRKPTSRYFALYSTGEPETLLVAGIYLREQQLRVGLILQSPDAKEQFRRLYDDRDAIERAIGAPLRWRERQEDKRSYIDLFDGSLDPNDIEQWPVQHRWMCEMLEAFHATFLPRLHAMAGGN